MWMNLTDAAGVMILTINSAGHWFHLFCNERDNVDSGGAEKVVRSVSESNWVACGVLEPHREHRVLVVWKLWLLGQLARKRNRLLLLLGSSV